MTPLAAAFDLVIFDWAGTMVDFGSRAPVIALVEAFGALGVTVTEAQARADMGLAKKDHVRNMLQAPDVAAAWRGTHGSAPGEDAAEAVMAALQAPMLKAAEDCAVLIPGAAETAAALRAAGLKIASSTGYTREMMQAVLARAEAQGYRPDHVTCSGETLQGRPSPLMVYKACIDLGVWPMSRVVKVDDAEVGVAEGRAAGCFTVGVAASGNGMGLSQEAFAALDPAERARRVADSAARLTAAGADMIIESVADLIPALHARAGQAA
ncbi:phosphonoacetaldehyde hydrolase [Phenylobacterium sp.]|uniref:phosphonoacetaldehyde hydrolase n=1 Tax=Phenylobacterium sp. TaxID=1871053 RepID=UPI00289BB6DC|nr:phosphonoacetaldehyde hydrolase [Phenylobacterium sp.]